MIGTSESATRRRCDREFTELVEYLSEHFDCVLELEHSRSNPSARVSIQQMRSE
jgi:hypothetical protein